MHALPANASSHQLAGQSAAPIDDRISVDGFRSTAFLAALRQVELFAHDDSVTILIEGASGTGKTQLARWIHRRSPRSRGPFNYITLSAVDDGLAASELFGHVAGAFTDARASRAGLFVSAAKGTLFLDEIGKASRAVQQKLLHVIEYGELRPVGADRDVRVDVRLIAAASENLEELAEAGALLPDLLARLSVFRVRLPMLSERRADIPILVGRYVRSHAARLGLPVPLVADELMSVLKAAPWPNNLRQLDATIHRIMLEADGAPTLTVEHCTSDLDLPSTRWASREKAVSKAEAEAAIDRAGGINAAAKLLGVHRTTIYRAQRRERSHVDETPERS